MVGEIKYGFEEGFFGGGEGARHLNMAAPNICPSIILEWIN